MESPPNDRASLPFTTGTGRVRAPGGYAVLAPCERLADAPRPVFTAPEAAELIALLVASSDRRRTPG